MKNDEKKGGGAEKGDRAVYGGRQAAEGGGGLTGYARARLITGGESSGCSSRVLQRSDTRVNRRRCWRAL